MKLLPPFIARLFFRDKIAFWTGSAPDWTAPQAPLLQSLFDRWQRYQSADIDRTLSLDDDMLVGSHASALPHYLSVGASAIEVISEAMVLARRSQFRRILDFPCGAGRVTRHLVHFFHDGEIFVSDIERKKQAFVESRFAVKAVECRADFSSPLPGRYDLIFVGSLVTHLNEKLFCRAVDCFIDALAPEGVLVLTTHGRNTAKVLAAQRAGMPRDPIIRAIKSFVRSGFGFFELDRRRYGVIYGASFCAPSWLAQLIERRSDAVILGIKERAWAENQDVLIVQKLPQRDTSVT